ncbi:single-stranded-DNA-specific exonuclease RecJ [Alkalihalophilus lindianensis]|uniref:Single-stranded-DNA-specific exonuclease RecJ n=1 Tax=Alkalihalophilus lindianensis TaxID=1630542 RepID=A0ABU3XDF7_9BACI|nr:single-stranded-DNA-specific exonuclease RecJ [Alkalihalophilus lindianensis]MDV2685921.1 single-stranded-DNA-specific exonuclease RecJ [Alkalihalophilus lindianensis]
MLKPKARWKIQEQDDNKVESLVNELGVDVLVAQLLINRGIDTPEAAKTFLNSEEMTYHDPYLLSGMKEAITRINEAITNQEKILIFGDYDADGVSSTSVMIYTLKELGAIFDYYIPNRFTEGYGPNEPALRRAKEEGYTLVVTVDTGISAVHEANVAREIGLDFIVTDHHEAPPTLPDAYAIVNPKKPGCTYPFKGLAGVGVAFKVAQALLGRIPKELLDIVVIGTIADLVPLVDENRLMAKEGLRALQSTSKPGLRALMKVCGVGQDALNGDHVGFGIGPRINAAGRLDSADPAVELMITNDPSEAEHLAAEIDALNKQRQSIVNAITEEAVEIVETTYPPSENDVLIIAKTGWNAGVIGIVASRLVERFYRPTIVLSIDEEKGLAKGSARSIEGFDMFSELSKSRDILPHFGGHPMAAGLTMKEADLDLLRERLNEQAKEVLTEEDFKPLTKIDLATSVDHISLSVIKQLEALAPFGVSNPTPKVMIENVHIDQMRRIGSEANHLKVSFAQNGASLDGIGFHLGHLHDEISQTAKLSAIGTLSINEWNGHVKPQMMLEDLAVNEWQLFDWRSIQQKRLDDRLLEIPVEKRIIISFQEESANQLGLHCEDIGKAEEVFRATGLFEDKYVILLDAPNTRDELRRLFTGQGTPSRVYTIFHQQEDSFFTTNPNRDQFKWFYAFLLKRKTFDLKKHGLDLAKHKGWSKHTIDFMSQVFLELGFVTIDNGILALSDSPEKKGLDESKSYLRKQEQAKIENQFVYSSYEELKQWFNRVILPTEIDERQTKETV